MDRYISYTKGNKNDVKKLKHVSPRRYLISVQTIKLVFGLADTCFL